MARPRSIDPGRSCSFWLKQSDIEALDALAEREGVTRSDLVHAAISYLLSKVR